MRFKSASLLAILIALLALHPASAPSQAPAISAPSSIPPTTGSTVPQDQAQAAVDFHNAKRRDVGSPPLQWSASLAAVAQTWANHLAADRNCGLEHTVDNKYGENLFGGNGRAFTALDASQAWYAEIKDYHGAVLTSANFGPTGHYTQMVWSASTSVGIGLATCPSGGLVIVAEYDPAGNYIGQKPY